MAKSVAIHMTSLVLDTYFMVGPEALLVATPRDERLMGEDVMFEAPSTLGNLFSPSTSTSAMPL